MSNKKDENGERTFSSRVVFEYPPKSEQIAMVWEVARHKAGRAAIIGGRVEPDDEVSRIARKFAKEPTLAAFKVAGQGEVNEETGNNGSDDPNDGLDVVVGDLLWQYAHPTNEDHITKVFAGVAIGGLLRPVQHPLGEMWVGSYPLDEIRDLGEHGLLRGKQDLHSAEVYMERRDELFAEGTPLSEAQRRSSLIVPQHLGERALA